jgi:hypothetical protein
MTTPWMTHAQKGGNEPHYAELVAGGWWLVAGFFKTSTRDCRDKDTQQKMRVREAKGNVRQLRVVKLPQIEKPTEGRARYQELPRRAFVLLDQIPLSLTTPPKQHLGALT